jgi:hypothetical protein
MAVPVEQQAADLVPAAADLAAPVLEQEEVEAAITAADDGQSTSSQAIGSAMAILVDEQAADDLVLAVPDLAALE